MNNLLINLREGLRISLFRKASRDGYLVSNAQLLLLIILQSIFVVASDYISAGIGASFNQYAIADFAFSWAVFLLLLYLVATFFKPENTQEFFVVVLSANIIPSICSYVYSYSVEKGFLTNNPGTQNSVLQFDSNIVWVTWIVIVVWMIIVVYRAQRLSLEMGKISSAFFASLSLVLHLGIYISVSEQPKMFWPSVSDNDEDSYQDELNVEDVYYKQHDLIDEALNNISPHRAGDTDLYLIGFAPYGYQDVFMREVEFVRSAVEQRYSTSNNSILLVNNEKAIDTNPLANINNLEIVLAGLKSKLNIDEDILMLYLTSHGSKNAVLSASLWPIQPNDLDAPTLKELLDASEIKYRVIIISACYSGSFIDELKNANTLIITASSADNTSFGCSDERELTYFAEAYFDHAWPQGKSLVETFEIAKIWVIEKELSEELTPSDPQIFIGEDISQILSGLEVN